MAAAVMQTPQKHPPGAFVNTPAVGRKTSQLPSNIFSLSSTPAPNQSVVQQQSPPNTTNSTSTAPQMTPIERAARSVNLALDEEARYPALDNYISQGFSSEYDTPISPAWAPFQKIKTFDIPDRVLEQFNQAQVSTIMGLFADINHAWISIDNALYLWDYTNPNPEIIGYEEQSHTITAVKMVTPRKGVFVDTISKLLVVATTSDIILIGVAHQVAQEGAKSISLYQTDMTIPVRGLNVQCIQGSPTTGRIFFSGRADEDIYELTYQQEESWFTPKTAKINHSRKGVFDTVIIPSIPFGRKSSVEYISQIVIDDARSTLYTLSSQSTIRAYAMEPSNMLRLTVSRTLDVIRNDLGHKVGHTSLLAGDTSIASIDAISSQEASRVNLMATTSSGCRIYFSAVSATYFGGGTSSNTAPSSMQVYHVKFPPQDSTGSNQPPPTTQPLAITGSAPAEISKALTLSRRACRLPPGYFITLVQKPPNAANDMLFLSAPDTARIAHPQDPSSVTKFHEFGLWLQLDSRAEDLGRVTAAFAASQTPQGFGNELAVQFDKPATEIAVLTNGGIHTIRRRRLVDIFAATVRFGGGQDGLEGEVNKLVKMYGRTETVATAIAVACGQASEVTADSRVAKITDPDTLEFARRAFVEQGGRPYLDENFVVDSGRNVIDNVRPSPRHEGLSLYLSRLLRSLWRSPVVRVISTPNGGTQHVPAVPLNKVQDTQRDLTRLHEFLNANKSSIEGLAGPEALGRVSTKQEEIALQAEHRAMNSLLQLLSDFIEGLSFVQVLFEEQVNEILVTIPEPFRKSVAEMTYERLLCTKEGRALVKELVRAIVNKNISQGSNVDTVTDALRRKCGKFCSPDDCVIFKAQELLQRASGDQRNTEQSRALLNESLRLFKRVSASLAEDQLEAAVSSYIGMEFFAGAIELALTAAHERDRGNAALIWLKGGARPQDVGASAFAEREKCYKLIQRCITALDEYSSKGQDQFTGQHAAQTRRVHEAFEVINESEDEAFQISLYDWYMSLGKAERLLDIRSSFVVDYLRRASEDDLIRADLLWRYFAQYNHFLEAAKVQLQLAQSTSFPLTLQQRIEYLSRARANASTKTYALVDVNQPRQSRQELVREVADLLDVANIQSDILDRIKSDERLTADRKPEVIKHLDGPILPLDELYNSYADQAGYFDVCLAIYHVADHRNSADIRSTWNNLVDQIHEDALLMDQVQPYQVVFERVRALGVRLSLSETVFPVRECYHHFAQERISNKLGVTTDHNLIELLLPMLKKYAFEFQRNVGPATWVVDLFLDISVPYEYLFATLETLFFQDEVPFKGKNRRFLMPDVISVIERWFDDTSQLGGRDTLLGGGGNADMVSASLQSMMEAGVLDDRQIDQCRRIREAIEQFSW